MDKDWELIGIDYDSEINPNLHNPNYDVYENIDNKNNKIDKIIQDYTKNKKKYFFLNTENNIYFTKIKILINQLNIIVTIIKFDEIIKICNKLIKKFEDNMQIYLTNLRKKQIIESVDIDKIKKIKDLFVNKKLTIKKGGKFKGGTIDKDFYIRFITLLIYILNSDDNIILHDFDFDYNVEINNNLNNLVSPIISTCITGISFLNLSYFIYDSYDIYIYNQQIINYIKYLFDNDEGDNIPNDINYNILFLTHKDLKIKKENKYNISSFDNTKLNDYFYNTDSITIDNIVNNTQKPSKLNEISNNELLFYNKKEIYKDVVPDNELNNEDKLIPMIIAIQKGSNLDIILTISGNMFWMYLRSIFDEFSESYNYNEMIADYVYSLLDLKFLNQTPSSLQVVLDDTTDFYDKNDNIYHTKKENIICYVKPPIMPELLAGGGKKKKKKGGVFLTDNGDNTINSKLLRIKLYMGYLIMLNPFLTSLNIHNILQKLINIIYKDQDSAVETVTSFKYINDLGLMEFCENIGKYYMSQLPFKKD